MRISSYSLYLWVFVLGIGVLFTRTWGCEDNSQRSVAMRVIEDLLGDAVILFVVSTFVL